MDAVYQNRQQDEGFSVHERPPQQRGAVNKFPLGQRGRQQSRPGVVLPIGEGFA